MGQKRTSESDRERFLRSAVNYLEILRVFDEGVIITDRHGRIAFYNETQARIDDTDPGSVLGLKATELYELSDETSLIMRCLRTRRPILNQHMVYRTRFGRIANSICSAYPLFDERGGLVGCVCFVRDYNLVEQTVVSVCSHSLGGAAAPAAEGDRYTFDDIVGRDPGLLRSIQMARMAALTPSSVMIQGETGTGKELFAQSIHTFGPWRDGPYVGINCAAIPENLLEGLLFGTVKGAFTGAVDRPGLFEKASKGTLFLDEVNSMPVGLQAKLLRVLQEKRVRRVGSLEEHPIRVKLVSSVNEDPYVAVREGRLRPDLFYRLGVVHVRIPPLRDRRGDIPMLVEHFLRRFNTLLGRNVERVAAGVMELFLRYPWPGNVRELAHVLEGGLNVVGDRRTLELRDLPSYVTEAGSVAPAGTAGDTRRGAAEEGGDLRAQQAAREREALERALRQSSGNITRAARALGISRQLLRYKMKKHGIERDAFAVGKTR